MKRLWKVIRAILETCLVIGIFVGTWTGAFYTEPYVSRLFGFEEGGYAAYLTASVISLVYLGVILAGFIIFAWSRHLEMLKLITDGLRRISKGDFRGIKAEKKFDGELDTIVTSINQMAEELSQLETMRQEFISNVSHEIQSPLTSIRGFALALQNDNLNGEDRLRYLQIIETETMRLSKLSDNLLKLTMLEAEDPHIEMKRYALDKQLRTIVLALEPQWQAKAVELDIALEETNIEADEESLSQVWTNLLHNAIKFTGERGTIRVELRLQPKGWAEVAIADNGIGIDAKQLPHIFERFYKADASRNRARGGSGLGLSIVKKIVDLHAGEVAVASVIGEGTTFTVRLPLTHAPRTS